MEHLKSEFHLEDEFQYNIAYQARPRMVMPILIEEKGETQLVNASWGITGAKETVNHASMARILTTRPYNVMIRSQRCAVPANCFFGAHKEKPYLVRLMNHRLFCLGGLYNKTQIGNEIKYSFCILGLAPADILQGYMDEMPIVISADRARKWLEADHLYKVMNAADGSVNHWFDFFEVSGDILNEEANKKELLKPIGLSPKQMEEKEEPYGIY